MIRIIKYVIANQFTTKGKTKNLDNWIDAPCQLHCSEGKPIGKIQYGVRIPMKPATTPLETAEPEDKKTRYGFKPAYWFIGDEPGLKVLLREIYEVNDSEIKANIKDGRYSTNAVIKKLK